MVECLLGCCISLVYEVTCKICCACICGQEEEDRPRRYRSIPAGFSVRSYSRAVPSAPSYSRAIPSAPSYSRAIPSNDNQIKSQ